MNIVDTLAEINSLQNSINIHENRIDTVFWIMAFGLAIIIFMATYVIKCHIRVNNQDKIINDFKLKSIEDNINIKKDIDNFNSSILKVTADETKRIEKATIGEIKFLNEYISFIDDYYRLLNQREDSNEILIEKLVKNITDFACHNKDICSDKLIQKLENMIDFLIRNLFLDDEGETSRDNNVWKRINTNFIREMICKISVDYKTDSLNELYSKYRLKEEFYGTEPYLI